MKLFLLQKFDNSSPSVTRDKEICHVLIWANDKSPEAEYAMEPFKWGFPAVQFDVSSISMTEDTQIFKQVILLTLGKLIYFSYFRQVPVVLLSLSKTFDPKSKPTSFDKKFKNHP